MGNRGMHTRILAGGEAITTGTKDVKWSIVADDLEDSYYGIEHSYMKGQFESDITIDGYFDGKTGPFHAALVTLGDSGLLTSIELGENATPAIGDITFSQYSEQIDYNVNPPKDGLIAASGSLKARGIAGEPGVLLMDQTITTTTTTASVDNSAASSNGASAYFYITGLSSGDTVELKITESANDIDRSDLMTCTLDGSAKSSERLTVSGAVARYIQGVATPTGSDISFPVAIIFNRK